MLPRTCRLTPRSSRWGIQRTWATLAHLQPVTFTALPIRDGFWNNNLYKQFNITITTTFTEALQLVERKKSLIGTTTEKGLLIDLIIIVPTDKELREKFVRSLMVTRSLQKTIVPFMESDVEVWATNSDYLYKQGILFYDVLSDWDSSATLICSTTQKCKIFLNFFGWLIDDAYICDVKARYNNSKGTAFYIKKDYGK